MESALSNKIRQFLKVHRDRLTKTGIRLSLSWAIFEKLSQEGQASCNLQKKTSSVCRNCSFFLFLYFFFFFGLERIAVLHQSYLACKIICQLPHVFAGHILKASLDATCLITHLVMPIPILLECAMNEIKRNIIYFIFLKNEVEEVVVKDRWSELNMLSLQLNNYTEFEMMDNIAWLIIPELLKSQIIFHIPCPFFLQL